jgi:hypothetical protein
MMVDQFRGWDPPLSIHEMAEKLRICTGNHYSLSSDLRPIMKRVLREFEDAEAGHPPPWWQRFEEEEERELAELLWEKFGLRLGIDVH